MLYKPERIITKSLAVRVGNDPLMFVWYSYQSLNYEGVPTQNQEVK